MRHAFDFAGIAQKLRSRTPWLVLVHQANRGEVQDWELASWLMGVFGLTDEEASCVITAWFERNPPPTSHRF